MLTKGFVIALMSTITVSAAALPSGLVSIIQDDSSELPYSVSEMEWTGLVGNSSEPVTLYGSMEDIVSQARKIDPNLSFHDDNVEKNTLMKRMDLLSTSVVW
ncbi:hypothetical protein MBLNU230_g0678t1 [Neophaeotheca triangularis]